MPHDFSRTFRVLALSFATLGIALVCCSAVAAQTGTVLYRFKGADGSVHDGAAPEAALTLAPNGTLFGTTAYGGTATCQDNGGYFYSCGTVFALNPPSGKSAGWTEQVIYDFEGGIDGFFPYGAPLILDGAGNLYGTTEWGAEDCGPPNYGGLCGTVFQLMPPAAKGDGWIRNLIYTFQPGGNDGFSPVAGLVFDGKGYLYGTTAQGGDLSGAQAGTVYQLAPPTSGSPSWTETVLYNFQGSPDGSYPAANIVMDAHGNLFSTTTIGGTGTCGGGCGTLFELIPPEVNGAPWTEKILYSFQAGSDGSYPNGIIFGKDGNLYGTTEGGGGNVCVGGWLTCGTIFKLAPPTAKGQPWTETVLYRFRGVSDGNYPLGNLVIDAQGRLYGTTEFGGSQGKDCRYEGCGTIFRLAQQGESWEEKVIYKFGVNRGGYLPQAGLTIGGSGRLYGTASTGGFAFDCGSNGELLSCGTVFEISK